MSSIDKINYLILLLILALVFACSLTDKFPYVHQSTITQLQMNKLNFFLPLLLPFLPCLDLLLFTVFALSRAYKAAVIISVEEVLSL